MKKISNEAFQGLWIEISFVNHKNIICGIIYGQHNSPNYFLTYLGKTVEILVSDDKNFYIMGDFNIDLLECQSSKISQEFFNLSSKLLSYSTRTNRSAFIELLLRWLTTSSLTILADFSLAETLFLILVFIFRSSILQLQRKIDFNKLKNIKYVTKTLCWSLSLWVVWNWLESNNCKWNEFCEQIVFIVLQQILYNCRQTRPHEKII